MIKFESIGTWLFCIILFFFLTIGLPSSAQKTPTNTKAIECMIAHGTKYWECKTPSV